MRVKKFLNVSWFSCPLSFPQVVSGNPKDRAGCRAITGPSEARLGSTLRQSGKVSVPSPLEGEGQGGGSKSWRREKSLDSR